MQVQTLNISLPEELVKKADVVAKSEYKTRSELIKSALMAYLKDKAVWDELFAYGKGVGKKMGIKDEGDVYKMIDEYRNEKGKIGNSN